MSGMLSVTDLLNPVQEGVHATGEIQTVIDKLSNSADPQVLLYLQQALSASAVPVSSALLAPPPPPQQNAVVEHGVKLNRQLTVQSLIRHPRGAIVEYPKSSGSDVAPIAHLFHMDMDPRCWDDFLPWKDFQYSLGKPRGRSLAGTFASISVLKDASGKEVDCVVHHKTCETKRYFLMPVY
jgi:hypothetical protein